MKADHENRHDAKDQLDEHAADAFASAATSYFLQRGSVIHATNQTGGQVAHSITNNFYHAQKYDGGKGHVEPQPMGLGRRGVQNNHRLSEQDLSVLREAASGDGTILMFRADSGLVVLVHDRQVNEVGNPRSEALYRQIIENLLSAGLVTQIETVAHVVVYKLTLSAYELIDTTK